MKSMVLKAQYCVVVFNNSMENPKGRLTGEKNHVNNNNYHYSNKNKHLLNVY